MPNVKPRAHEVKNVTAIVYAVYPIMTVADREFP